MKRKLLISPSICIIFGILFIYLMQSGLSNLGSNKLFYWVVAIIIVLSFVVVGFELFLRPDFIVTDKMIVLFNRPLAYLITKKDFRYIAEYDQIEKSNVFSTDIHLTIKNNRSAIRISFQSLDDFQTAETLILEQLEKRNILFNRPRV